MKKVIFGITSLTMGGAERVLVDICNVLVKRYDITILTLYGEGEFVSELDSKIKVKSIYETSFVNTSKFKRKWLSLQLQVPFLRNKLYQKWIGNDYDTVVAFLEGPITWLLSASKSYKVAWIHNDITSVFGNGLKTKIKLLKNKEKYKKYNKLLFVSNDNLDKFTKTIKTNNSKEVIYNYIDEAKVLKKADAYSVKLKNDYPNFVVVSRLTSQKAIDRLIDVHKKLIDEEKKHYIYVVGTGPLEQQLKLKIEELKLSDTFILVGGKTNPYPYIKSANYFGLFSYYEGYPMVLLEARILNAKIVITDTAAREVLKDYHNKLIIDNSFDGIYKGIKKVLENDLFDNKKEKFSNQKIIEQIEKVIEG